MRPTESVRRMRPTTGDATRSPRARETARAMRAARGQKMTGKPRRVLAA